MVETAEKERKSLADLAEEDETGERIRGKVDIKPPGILTETVTPALMGSAPSPLSPLIHLSLTSLKMDRDNKRYGKERTEIVGECLGN